MRILLVFLSIFLSSCTTGPKIVKVPVPVDCPKPKIKPMPYLPIHSLQETSTPPEVMKAWVSTAIILNGYAKECAIRCGLEDGSK